MPEIGIVPFFILFDHFCFNYVFPYCAFVLDLKLTTAYFDHVSCCVFLRDRCSYLTHSLVCHMVFFALLCESFWIFFFLVLIFGNMFCCYGFHTRGLAA